MDNGNTVGGLNLLGPAFTDIGMSSIKLSELTVANAAGGEVGTGACGVDVIDENGNTVTHYSWKSSGRGATKTWAWYDGSAKIEDNVVFARGAGLLFTAENAGDTLMSAGEVFLDTITISETVAGLNVVANPFPCSIKLNALTVTSSTDGEVGTGACGADTIDENGNTVKHYSWKSSGRGATKTWAWYDGSTIVGDDVVLPAGSAILFTAENAGDKLVFPAQK